MKFRILTQLITCPWQIYIAQKIKIIFPFYNLVKDKPVTLTKGKFAPHLHHLHIGIDKQRNMSTLFQ